MDRGISRQLETWATNSAHKPLIIRGMRQIGKTWSVRELAKTKFGGRLCEVDFEYNPAFRRIFDGELNPQRLCRELEVITGKPIIPGETLLFFDEVQACPRALESLRYFYEQLPDLHLIAAGSLLEFALDKISFPVGRVTFIEMYPMTFFEYLLATGDSILPELLKEPPHDLGETAHERLLRILADYMFCGGLPECVNSWLRDRRYAAVRQVHDDLLRSFRQDFSKYAVGVDSGTLEILWDGVSANVSCQVTYAALSRERTGTTNKKAVELLKKIRLVRECHAVSAAGLPLMQLATHSKFFAADIGLWQAQLNRPALALDASRDLLAVYEGALTEQFVAQELAAGLGDDEPHWWKREKKGSAAEVDFIVVAGDKVQPIEVKGGASGRLRSMHQLLAEHPNCADGIVFSSARFGTMPAQRLRFLPLYYATVSDSLFLQHTA